MRTGGIVHQPGHDKGMDPVLALFIDGAVILVPGVHAAGGRAQHHARAQAQFPLEDQPGLLDRLARGQQGELGELVVKDDLLAVEIGLWFPVADLATDLDRQPVHIAEIQRADAAAPSRIASKVAGTSRPSALTVPMPVMATRRMPLA